MMHDGRIRPPVVLYGFQIPDRMAAVPKIQPSADPILLRNQRMNSRI
jgi:hypothetical protein